MSLKENVSGAACHIYETKMVVYFLKTTLPNILSETTKMSISSQDFKYTTLRVLPPYNPLNVLNKYTQ